MAQLVGESLSAFGSSRPAHLNGHVWCSGDDLAMLLHCAGDSDIIKATPNE